MSDMTAAQRAAARSYVELCPECRGVTGAIVIDVDHPGKEWNRELAGFVSGAAKAGYLIETWTCADVRSAAWDHRAACSRARPKKRAADKQSDLFAADEATT